MRVAVGILFSLIVSLFVSAPAYAGSLSRMSDQMDTVESLTESGHVIQFVSASGMFSGSIIIDLAQAISSVNNITPAHITLSYGAAGNQQSYAVGSNSGSNVWGVQINSETKRVTLTYPSSGATPIVTGDVVTIGIGASAQKPINAAAGNSLRVTVSTPQDSGQYAISLVPTSSFGIGAVVDGAVVAASQIPAAPVLVGISGLTAVTVRWEDTSSIETGFIIERRVTAPVATDFVEVGRSAQNAVAYVDSAVLYGATYIYRVRAVNGDYLSSPSNEGITTLTGSNTASIVNNQSLSEQIATPSTQDTRREAEIVSPPSVDAKAPSPDSTPKITERRQRETFAPETKKREPARQPAAVVSAPPVEKPQTSTVEISVPAAPVVPVESPQPQNEDAPAGVPVATLPLSLQEGHASSPVIELPPVTLALAAPVSAQIVPSQESTVSVIQTGSNGETVGMIAVVGQDTADVPFRMDVAVVPLSHAASIDADIIPTQGDVRSVDGLLYQVNAFLEDQTPLRTFNKCIDIRLKYDPTIISKAFEEQSLHVAHWNTIQRRWVAEDASVIDVKRRIVSSKVCHLTLFSLFGKQKKINGVPVVPRVLARPSVSIKPSSSLLLAEELGMIRLSDGQPVSILGREIFISAYSSVEMCIKEHAFLPRRIETFFVMLGNEQFLMNYDKTRSCYAMNLPIQVKERRHPLILKVLYADDRVEKLTYTLVVTRPSLERILPLAGIIIESLTSSPQRLITFWFFVLLTIIALMLYWNDRFHHRGPKLNHAHRRI